MEHAELIARLEAAPEGSRELDVEIWDTVDAWPIEPDQAWRMAPNGCPVHALTFAPSYTTSVDTALTLVRDNSWATIDRYSISDEPGPNPFAWRVWIKWLDGDLEGDGPLYNHKVFSGTKATPALALCIAALKARGETP